MNKLLSILIPRFMTDVAAFQYSDQFQAYVPVCSVMDVQKGEIYKYGVVKGFNFFGMLLFAKMQGELFNLTWSQIENYQKGVK